MKEYRSVQFINCCICIVLSILYFVDLPLNGWTFHLSHANVFHLCANMIAVSAIFKSVDYRLLIIAYLTTTVMWYMQDADIVGFSAIIFFMWGTRVINDFKILLNYPNSINMDVKQYGLGILATFILSAVIPSLAFSLHFFPFITGVLVSLLIILFRNFKKDISVCR